jgi:hypothetical protein
MSPDSGGPSRLASLYGNRSRNRPRIDWLAVELDYRTGVMSLREMADKHGCSHSTIANFAGRQGWSRPQLTHAVRLRGGFNPSRARDIPKLSCKAWPKAAVYDGKGSTDDAANFRCRNPHEERGRRADDDADDD